ncbi:hypothetical protein [uncultured Paludibaculum sp.]|uniref:hypothetical protein n=1 Tax=uncultured Paludibaculum sp. TaxID=1765020 RepID=UPI002AAC1C68|nr:hypothetical protein [uncultured Paludibaculum sp.]
MTQERSPQCPLESDEHAWVLMDYCAGHLDRQSQEILELHIANCLHCKEFCADQRAVWKTLDVWRPAPLDPGFDARLFALIQERPGWTTRVVSWLREVSWKPAIPAAALLTAYFVIVAPMPPAPRITQTRAEVQQVEQALADLDMLQQLKLSDR